MFNSVDEAREYLEEEAWLETADIFYIMDDETMPPQDVAGYFSSYEKAEEHLARHYPDSGYMIVSGAEFNDIMSAYDYDDRDVPENYCELLELAEFLEDKIARYKRILWRIKIGIGIGFGVLAIGTAAAFASVHENPYEAARVLKLAENIECESGIREVYKEEVENEKGEKEIRYGVVCKQADGSWKILN